VSRQTPIAWPLGRLIGMTAVALVCGDTATSVKEDDVTLSSF
jgi:hypothetical protein